VKPLAAQVEGGCGRRQGAAGGPGRHARACAADSLAGRAEAARGWRVKAASIGVLAASSGVNMAHAISCHATHSLESVMLNKYDSMLGTELRAQ